MRFRVLVGKHSEGYHEDGSPKVYCADGSCDGNVVESATDLRKKNTPNGMKFLLLPDNDLQAAPLIEAAKAGFTSKPDDDGLSLMSVTSLRELAEEEEVDLGTVTRKDQIVGLIREARKSLKAS